MKNFNSSLDIANLAGASVKLSLAFMSFLGKKYKSR